MQLAPTEVCDSRCTFCSFGNRDPHSAVDFGDIETGLRSFHRLGAQGLELTGGGNPLLYKCKRTGKTINDIISLAQESYGAIGMITNGFDLNRIGKAQSAALTWVRISGVKFFEGKTASDIDLGYVQPERVGFNFVCPIGTVTSRTPGSEVRLSALLELLDAILALSKYSFHPYRARFRSRDPGRSICR
ncbi:MAG: radical SAM protein [Gammaproteobacteria bacterium]